MILACPGCDSRYDVTGVPVGTQRVCRCGTTLTVRAPKPEAGMLACPHCGGGASPTSPRCAYCQTELLLKACPRCLSRVFHGHKHCPECGAGLELAATTAEQRTLPCPRCEVPLRGRLVGDVLIDECGKCLGLFLDHVAIQRLVTDRRQSRAEALLGALPRAELRPVPPGGKMYIKCPSCAAVMNRKLFATGAGVIVDVCRHHGTFFDVGELPVIIDFVMKGGLEAAERKELDAERRRLERQKAALDGNRVSGAFMIDMSPGHATSGAFVDLLMHLIS